ncbi:MULTISPECIES: DUF2301 domain-containing membrane protein [unclassified Synechococcus]|uniref:DUF2301 domain-containing membrane protein n=1 Tax=unclassified Synechococcus TaxID=2626047 RepID=UPI0000699404|nr:MULTISPECIES: DUF2301 domain-containing membrane protein [unclassified Synechococcus]EAQ76236.1 conserved hypothetical membrane protein [Synechococcus sp. WH 5701]WFN58934.1 DUF2301 domain-containing membrane protein [Synechococcus sp. CCFWC 502]
MTDRSQHEGSPDDPVFEGIYGPFTITARDRREVLGYRMALLGVALAQGGLLLQWANRGSQGLWPWLVLMAVGLGLALRWIHIYLRPLHRALQLFWLLGCAGGVALALQQGQGAMLDAVATDSRWIWAVGPFFAALAGVGFKEFFCFQRPEAIGVTLLLPVALLGRLVGLLDERTTFTLLAIEAALLLILTLRKFPMQAAADVGDKSVFAYLESQRPPSQA